MKRILILAYDFPPYVSVGGLRPFSWYKYLSEFDVYPIVITRDWSTKFGNHLDYIAPSESKETTIVRSSHGTIIKTPYYPNLSNLLTLKYGDSKFKFLRKILSVFYEILQFLFFIGPKSPLYFEAKEYLSQDKVDVIIATGDPFILFKYAAKLSKSFGIPWIADYRDPWTQGIFVKQMVFYRHWTAFFEKRIVNSAVYITTVSKLFRNQISSLINNKKFYIIANGYDPEASEKAIYDEQQTEVFSIAFAGSIYSWHPIRSFLSVVSEFINENKDISLRINFYGVSIALEFSTMISNEFSNLKQYISISPKVANDHIFRELANNNVLLLFNDYSIIGTKIYDYLAAKRSILFCYANDKEAIELKNKYYNISSTHDQSIRVQEELIIEANAGYIAKDKQHLLTILEDLYHEFKENGFIKCHTTNTEKYSRKSQTKKLAEIIKNIGN